MLQDKITHQIEGADSADTEQVADAPLPKPFLQSQQSPLTPSACFDQGNGDKLAIKKKLNLCNGQSLGLKCNLSYSHCADSHTVTVNSAPPMHRSQFHNAGGSGHSNKVLKCQAEWSSFSLCSD